MFKDIGQAMRALDAADKAGEEQDAQDIAKIIRSMKAAPTKSPAITAEEPIDYQQQNIDEMSWGQKALVGIGSGMANTLEGVSQLGLQAGEALGIVDDGTADRYTAEKTNDRKYLKKLEDDSPLTVGGGQILGSIASMPIPGVGAGKAAASIGTKLGTRALDAASRTAQGAALGGAFAGTQFVGEGESRLDNIKEGLAIGGAAQFGLDRVGSAGRRLLNGKAGNFKNAEAGEIIDEGRRRGVDVMFDDVTTSPMAKKIGVAAENAGALGTASRRLRQNEQAERAAVNYADSLMDDVAGGDFVGAAQKGLQDKLKTFKKIAGGKFKKAALALDRYGEVDVTGYQKALDDAIALEGRAQGMADDGIVAILTKFKGVNNGSFSDVTEARKVISSEISKFYKGNSALGERGVNLLQSAKSALDDDLAKFAQGTDEASFGLWKSANAFYADKIAKPFKQTRLKTLINDNEPEKAWKYLMQGGGETSRAKTVYQSMDNKGRAAIRAGMVKDALSAATAENRPFSPARFAQSIEKRMKVADTFFKGSEKKELLGMSKLMRHVERSGQLAENPPNGSRLIPILMTFGATVEPVSMSVGAGAALSIKTLYQTEKGRMLLMAASERTPATKNFDEVVGRINTLIGRAAVAESAK